MEKNIKLSYIVSPNDFLNAGGVSEDVKANLEKMNIDSEIIRKATMAIYESELNMIIHANGGIIDVEITADGISVEAADNGPGIPDVEQAMEPGFTTLKPNSDFQAKGIGKGRGLSNIRKSTDFFDIETELGCGTTIRFGIDF